MRAGKVLANVVTCNKRSVDQYEARLSESQYTGELTFRFLIKAFSISSTQVESFRLILPVLPLADGVVSLQISFVNKNCPTYIISGVISN